MSEKEKHFTENDRIFYSDGYKLAQSVVDQGISNQSLFAAMESLYTAIDGLNESVTALAKRQNSAVACIKGCDWCCRQEVYAGSYELHYLSAQIKLIFSPDELSELKNRIEEKYESTSKLTDDEVLNFKSACPLLRDGACSMYSFRPMACRIYMSTKLDTCINFYHHPEDETNFPALIEFPLRAGRMMNEGFGAALKEIGVQSVEFRLEDGLRRALQTDLLMR